MVFTLKKRVLVYESNHELVEIMEKCGSVHAMVATMRELEAENQV